MRRGWTCRWLGCACLGLWAGVAAAEQPLPLPTIPKLAAVSPETGAGYEKLSLTEAIRRALARHPAAIVSQLEIARAEALVTQARASSLPSLTATGSLLRLDADRTMPGRVIARKDQQSANLQLGVPLIAPSRWTTWSRANENVETARASNEETRRNLAVSVARAYLAVISQKRLVDTHARAVAADRSHYEHTHTRFAGGVGNRVDEVRAAQQLAVDQALLSGSYSALARAREALGVLVGEDKPLDVLDDIALPAPEDRSADRLDEAADRRKDVRAAKQRAQSAEKTKNDGWTDHMPTLSGQFQPFYQHPATLTQPETGWQAMLVLTIPLLEGGLRVGQKREREAILAEARAQYDGLLRQTRSELRMATETIRRAEEVMHSAQAAAELAHQGLDLALLAYGAGATTNIEVVDAERRARDADSAVVVAEDSVRQARLDLLVAAGQFP